MKTFRVAIIVYIFDFFNITHRNRRFGRKNYTVSCHAECFPSMSIVRVVPIVVGVSWSREEEERAAKPVFLILQLKFKIAVVVYNFF